MLFVQKKKKKKENNDASSLVIKDRPGPPRFIDLQCFYRWWLVTYDGYYQQHCN